MASEGEEIDNRLTNKHIQTLQYLQNVLSENKELKSRIAELQVIVTFTYFLTSES